MKNALSSHSLQKEFQLLYCKGLRDLDVSKKKSVLEEVHRHEKGNVHAQNTNVTRAHTSGGTQGAKKQTSYSNLRVNPAMGRADVSVALWSTLILHPSLSLLSLCQPLSAQTSLQSPLFFLFSLPKSDISGKSHYLLLSPPSPSELPPRHSSKIHISPPPPTLTSVSPSSACADADEEVLLLVCLMPPLIDLQGRQLVEK